VRLNQADVVYIKFLERTGRGNENQEALDNLSIALEKKAAIKQGASVPSTMRYAASRNDSAAAAERVRRFLETT
jgi:hypothetical protein